MLGSWLVLIAGQGAAASEYPPCTKTPSTADITAAKGAFQAGQVYFREANYGQAERYWRDAYTRDCTAHRLLLNLATAYQLDGQTAEAAVALETYLKRAPNAADRGQVERRLAKLRTQLAKARAASAAEAAKVSQATASPESEPEATEALETSGGRPTSALILAGAGGLVAAGGVAWFVVESGNVSDWENVCKPSRSDPNKRVCPTADDESSAVAAQNRRTASVVVLAAGAAAAAGGLLWYFLTPAGAEGPKIQTGIVEIRAVAPVIAQEFAGLSVAGSF